MNPQNVKLTLKEYTQQELYDMSNKTQPYTFFKNFYGTCGNGSEWFYTCIGCSRSSKFVKFADKSRCNSCKNKQNKKNKKK